MSNIDKNTVEGFGDEWSRFNQTGLTVEDHHEMSDGYFSIVPWEKITKNSVGFDLGCGSGRWARTHSGPKGKLQCLFAEGLQLCFLCSTELNLNLYREGHIQNYQ